MIIEELNYQPTLLGYEDELRKGAILSELSPEYYSYEEIELTINSRKAKLAK